MTVRLPIRVTVVAVASVLTLAGCTSEEPGTATPVSSAPQSSGASSNPDVPKVATPLDPSKYLSEPCTIVPAPALSALKFTDPGTAQQRDEGLGAAGPSCGWQIRGEGQSMVVIIATGNRDRGAGGLAGLYTAHETGQYPFLEPAPEVAGYPAVYVDKRDRRPNGFCSLDMGVADDLVIAVHSGGYEGADDSCAAASQVAAAIITTLKGA
ncbi:Protein of unknown function [Amycolatopsis pretoriensis]|uniref:DUF3558 domain-containing protein n=1 Tax=Amycolatopsis pretoriensis TaxID=218821 RepID=A0A1H5Q897_9PSEU|nr:DUF3558 domain-containing protein [Amycolatopsis pretoriensis]SEF22330.1 Protein of unknown function [Amycolatopsis pretoriensis]